MSGVVLLIPLSMMIGMTFRDLSAAQNRLNTAPSLTRAVYGCATVKEDRLRVGLGPATGGIVRAISNPGIGHEVSCEGTLDKIGTGSSGLIRSEELGSGS